MKVVALALALLLAIGSQAASLQADAPSQLQHIRAAADMYINELKEGAKKALDALDTTEYSDYKVDIIKRIDDFHLQLKALQQNVSPMTDSFVSTVDDATKEFRQSIVTDFETLKTDVEPRVTALREIVEKHYETYRTQAEPIIKEYMEKSTANVEALKTNMEPVVEQLRTNVWNQLEETKTALEPIVEAVRSKVTTHVEALKTMVTPYVEEYQEQVKQAYKNAQGITTDDLTAFKDKITPLLVDIKVKLAAISEAALDVVSQK